MDIEQILDDFALAEQYPADAVQACLDDPSAVTPAFLDILRRCADNAEDCLEDEDTLFFVIHVLGALGEKRAFQPLMTFLGDDQFRVELILGDAITETIPQILISTFDGQTDALYRIMNAGGLDEFVRAAVFHAWTYFVIEGRIDRDEAHEYLRGFFENGSPRDASYVWVSWMEAVANIGFDDLHAQVKAVFADGRIPDLAADYSDFERMTSNPLKSADREKWLRSERYNPFRDIAGAIGNWQYHTEDDARRTDDTWRYGEFADTATNPYRNVGRNDPCPCGSGKKFKRCCLQ